MQEGKKFALDVSLTFTASMINMLLTFVISVILGRYLGAADLGLYRLTYTFYGVATMVGAIGIPVAVIKYVAEYKDDKVNLDKTVSSGIVTSLAIGTLFTTIIYLLSQTFANLFHMPQLKSLLELLSPIFPFVLINAILYGTLNGLREMEMYAKAMILQQAMMTASTIILIYFGFGVSGAIISMVLSTVCISAYLIYTCRKQFHLIFDEYMQTTIKLIRFGTQMFGANLINMINLQADTIFIGYFLSAANVGYYSAATGLGKFFWVVPQAIQTISYPATAEFWTKKDIPGLQNMLDKSMKFTALALMPAGLVIGFFAEFIVTEIYGQGFHQSALPLQVLLLGTVIFGITCTSIGGTLAGVNRPDLSLKAAGISATANIMLNIVLIPKFGIVGAAIATATSLLIMAFAFDLMTVRTLCIRFDIRWLISATITALLGIAAFSIGVKWINPYLLGLVILVIFTTSIFRMILTREDIDLLKSFINFSRIRLNSKNK